MTPAAAEALATLAGSAPVVVYAIGSGCGHLTRALNLLGLLGVPGTVLHLAGTWSPVEPPPGVRLVGVAARDLARQVPRLLGSHAAGALVVDTFPGGLVRELSNEVLARFRVRALVRRYMRPGSYEDEDELAARFDLHLLPYDPERCEWEGKVPGVHVGPLVRRLELAEGAPCDLAIVGSPDRLPSSWRTDLPEQTTSVAGPLRRLPRARAYLAVGAGHNLSYELLSAGVSFRALPEERRYDDQFRRADRLGVGVCTRDELRTFLRRDRNVARA